MKMLYCWRCKMEVPMLDDDEFAKAYKIYGEVFTSVRRKGLPKGATSLKDAFKPFLDYYNNLTGWDETNPNAILHHHISIYGPPCENCGKPYRTPEASFCAACGHKSKP
ncbi:hypothetical protein BKI52_15485 [marine bacterium AO1-C]|nr:hypothetical protein BKI52_15485 [marine bacterium AO1-C]